MARILEQTSLSGAYATRLLAEAGHDVIRLESREGDDVRRMGPFLRGKADLEHGVFHQFLNAGKRSLSVDLDHALGKEIFASLLRTTDAVVTSSLSPIGDPSLLQANSNLVVIKRTNRDRFCDAMPGKFHGAGDVGLYVHRRRNGKEGESWQDYRSFRRFEMQGRPLCHQPNQRP